MFYCSIFPWSPTVQLLDTRKKRRPQWPSTAHTLEKKRTGWGRTSLQLQHWKDADISRLAQDYTGARTKPKSSKSHASAFATGLSPPPVRELFLPGAKQGKWQRCFVPFLQREQKVRVGAKPGGTEDGAPEAAVSVKWVIPAASRFHLLSSLDRSSPLSPQHLWPLGLAELIHLRLLCCSLMPASPQNIRSVFDSSFNWEQG